MPPVLLSRRPAPSRGRHGRVPSRRHLVAGLLAVVLAVGAAAPAAGAGSSGVPAAATATTVTVPAPDEGPVPNPDRGWVRWAGTHYRVDRTGHVPLDAAVLRRGREQDGITLVWRVAYLERFVDRDVVDPEYLQLLAADLDTARRSGVRLVLRLGYSETGSRDAPADRAVGHVAQLAPVLRAHSDVLSAVQVGLVGRWGEWYYSDSYTSDPARPWALSEADWRARGRVLQAVLDAVPGVPVQVRTPEIAQRLVPQGHPDAPRVGVHNDCFLADAHDAGTYRHEADRAWLRTRPTTAVLGGETCAVNLPRSGWGTARAELAGYGWTFLNRDYHPDVLAGWGRAGQEEVGRLLGYRLRVARVEVPSTAAAGVPATVTLSVANDGWAAPVRPRPVRLVVSDARTGAVVTTRAVDLDVRRLLPGTTTTVSVAVTVPVGRYDLALALPDGSPRLAADPAYAIRLANLSAWDPATGRNRLGASLTAEPVPAPTTPTPSPSPSPSPSPTAGPPSVPTVAPRAPRPRRPAAARAAVSPAARAALAAPFARFVLSRR